MSAIRRFEVGCTHKISDCQSDLGESKGSLKMPRLFHLRDDGKHGGDTTISEDEGSDSSDGRVKRWVLE